MWVSTYKYISYLLVIISLYIFIYIYIYIYITQKAVVLFIS